jgi:hypothetical protein
MINPVACGPIDGDAKTSTGAKTEAAVEASKQWRSMDEILLDILRIASIEATTGGSTRGLIGASVLT